MPNYWTLLINRWQLMGGILLSAMIIGVIWTTSRVPLYTTSATLLIEPPQSLPESDDTGAEQERYYQTQIDLLRSPSLAAQVIATLQLGANSAFIDAPKKRAGLNRFFAWLYQRFTVLFSYSSFLFGRASQLSTAATPRTNTTHKNQAELTAFYLTLLTIKPAPDAYSVEVEFTTPDPTLSQALANAHVQTFVRTSQTTRFELPAEGRAFLDQQLVTQQERLAQAQARVQQFRQDHQDLSSPASNNLSTQRVLDIYQRLSHARARRLEAETLRRVTDQKETPQFGPLVQNDRVTQLQSTLTKLATEHARLKTMLSPSHPHLEALSTAQNTTQQVLARELTAIVRTLEAEHTAALSAETLLQEEAAQQQKTALELGDFETVLATLTAEVDSSRMLVEAVRQQQQEGAILKPMVAPHVSITAAAELPWSPSSPHPRHDLVFALIAGLVGAAGCAFFAEWMDTSVRTSQDVWLTTAYPTLGVIPPHASWFQLLMAKGQHALHSFANQSEQKQTGAALSTLASREMITVNSSLIAPYHALGTALSLEGRNSPRSLLVTSPHPREGKTVTTLNLAISLAWSDYKVVVVDANLRAGRCHTLLQREKSPGLGEVLLEGVTLAALRRRMRRRSPGESPGEAASVRDVHTQETTTDEQQHLRPAQKLKALVEAVVQTTAINGLSLVACGHLPIDPTEGLASQTMQEVLHVLRRQYDYVLVDSPAALTADDAVLLAQQCDATLLVLRGHTTPMVAAHHVAEQLQRIHANVLGVVLVDVNPHSAEMETSR